LSSTSGSGNTSAEENKRIRGIFIKFKSGNPSSSSAAAAADSAR
jgi:hypothetical protein